MSIFSQWMAEIRGDLAKKLTKAGIYLTSQIRGYLNTYQPYTRSRSGKRYRGKMPSRPGQFPHKLSGQLIKSITWEVDKNRLELTVFSNMAGYPKWLNTGTYKMRPRPFMRLAWELEKDNVAKLVSK